MSQLNGRQVTDAARIFTGALVGTRDSAIKYNAPRGIRLLPDPILTIPAPGSVGAGSLQLCYNRMIAIEPAGDYSEGKITIGPLHPVGGGFPPAYPRGTSATVYPFPDAGTGNVNVLMVEESPFVGGYVVGPPASTPQPNSPTSWYWNVRVGDKIKIGGTGRSYTIVGPCVVNPWNDYSGNGIGNTELFVNVGPPGTQIPLTRSYYYTDGTVARSASGAAAIRPEFLFVVNGEDDDLDGYVDEGWDGYDQNVTANADDILEWETEKWVGSLTTNSVLDPTATTESPSSAWITGSYQSGTHDQPYIINRRPVPTPGAREVMLPAGMVIDATTWNSTAERSRLPVSAGSLYCDVMVNPNGRYIPTTEYSSPTSASPLPFLHFWIASRDEVFPRGSVWGVSGTGVPNPNPSNTATATYFELPMTNSALGVSGGAYVSPTAPGGFYPGATTTLPVLKGDRRLVTMFAQSGLVTVNTVESIPPPNVYQPGEGFNVADVGYPFIKVQQGSREAR